MQQQYYAHGVERVSTFWRAALIAAAKKSPEPMRHKYSVRSKVSVLQIRTTGPRDNFKHSVQGRFLKYLLPSALRGVVARHWVAFAICFLFDA